MLQTLTPLETLEIIQKIAITDGIYYNSDKQICTFEAAVDYFLDAVPYSDRAMAEENLREERFGRIHTIADVEYIAVF
jgi:hypothetical protein